MIDVGKNNFKILTEPNLLLLYRTAYKTKYNK